MFTAAQCVMIVVVAIGDTPPPRPSPPLQTMDLLIGPKPEDPDTVRQAKEYFKATKVGRLPSLLTLSTAPSLLPPPPPCTVSEV